MIQYNTVGGSKRAANGDQNGPALNPQTSLFPDQFGHGFEATVDASLGHPGFQPFRLGLGQGTLGTLFRVRAEASDMGTWGDSVQPLSTPFRVGFPFACRNGNDIVWGWVEGSAWGDDETPPRLG